MAGHRQALCVFVALLVVLVHGEQARNDHLQGEEEGFVADGNEEVVESMKRFLLNKKTTPVTTGKPTAGVIGALFTTTTKASKTSSGSRFGVSSSTMRTVRPRITPAPTKDACGTINPCKNGGSCKTLSSGRFYCFCPQDYYGKNCENKFISTGTANRDRAPTDHCVKSPCRNGGECIGLRTTYYCRCKSPYYGTTCDKRINK